MPHRHELPLSQWRRIAPFFPHRIHHGGRGRPLEDHRRLFNGMLWRLPGEISLNATARGRRFTVASDVGDAMAHGRESLLTSWKAWSDADGWDAICGLSTQPSFVPAALRPGPRIIHESCRSSAAQRRRNSKNQLDMRSGIRVAASAPRFICWSQITGSSSAFTSPRDSSMNRPSSSRSCGASWFHGIEVHPTGPTKWRRTKATVIHIFAAGRNDITLRRSSQPARTKPGSSHLTEPATENATASKESWATTKNAAPSALATRNWLSTTSRCG
jgi:hypothetical protein